jgi:hypothetical protein
MAHSTAALFAFCSCCGNSSPRFFDAGIGAASRRKLKDFVRRAGWGRRAAQCAEAHMAWQWRFPIKDK